MVREIDCLFYMIKEHVWVSLVDVKADKELVSACKYTRPPFRGCKL